MGALLALVASTAFAQAPDFQAYRGEVRSHTERSYRQNIDQIDPGRVRGVVGGRDLDHKTPIKGCYSSGMSAAACGAPSNLQMLPSSENRSLGCKVPGCKD